MKFLMITLAVLLAQTSFSSASEKTDDVSKGREFSCVVTSDNKRYEDIFLLELGVYKGVDKLVYKRLINGVYTENMVVSGCLDLQSRPMKHRPEWLSYECDDDGEYGSISINPNTGVGEIYFYLPSIGYGERTALDLNCVEK